MNHKKIIVILILIFLVASITVGFVKEIEGGWPFESTPTQLQEFTPELVETLFRRFYITIPDYAKLIKGMERNSLIEPSIVLLFELPVTDSTVLEGDPMGYAYLSQALNLDPNIYLNCGKDSEIMADWFEDYGGIMDYCIYTETGYATGVSYSLKGNTILVRFYGTRVPER